MTIQPFHQFAQPRADQTLHHCLGADMRIFGRNL
jgi:hypothetical protein